MTTNADHDAAYQYPPHRWNAQPGAMPTVGDIVNERNALRVRVKVLEAQLADIPWADLRRLVESISTPIWDYANLYPDGKNTIMTWLDTHAPEVQP